MPIKMVPNAAIVMWPAFCPHVRVFDLYPSRLRNNIDRTCFHRRNFIDIHFTSWTNSKVGLCITGKTKHTQTQCDKNAQPAISHKIPKERAVLTALVLFETESLR